MDRESRSQEVWRQLADQVGDAYRTAAVVQDPDHIIAYYYISKKRGSKERQADIYKNIKKSGRH